MGQLGSIVDLVVREDGSVEVTVKMRRGKNIPGSNRL